MRYERNRAGMRNFLLHYRDTEVIKQVLLDEAKGTFRGPYEVKETLPELKMKIAIYGLDLLDVTEKCDKSCLQEH